MARPTDWNPLASSDPIPGDPGVVRQAAQNYADVAEAINTAKDRLNAITFKGKSHHIDKLRSDCEDLVVQIKQASSRCSGAAGALKTYAGALEGAQAKSLPILKEAKEAQGDQRRWKQEEWEQYYRHQRTTNPVERSRAESDYRAAQSKRAAAEGRIAQARERLKAVIKERDEAGNRAADALRETSRNSPLKDTFWEKIENAFSDFVTWLEKTVLPALEDIGIIITVLTIVAAVVSVAVTGGAATPVVALLLAAGAAVSVFQTAGNLVVNGSKLASGEMSWGEFIARTTVDVAFTTASVVGAAGAVKGAFSGAKAAVDAAKPASALGKALKVNSDSNLLSKDLASNVTQIASIPSELAGLGVDDIAGAALKKSIMTGRVGASVYQGFREVITTTANDMARGAADTAVDLGARGKTDRDFLDSFTGMKFYNLITTGHANPQTASAPSSGANSTRGGGGGGGW